MTRQKNKPALLLNSKAGRTQALKKDMKKLELQGILRYSGVVAATHSRAFSAHNSGNFSVSKRQRQLEISA